jgi:integrase
MSKHYEGVIERTGPRGTTYSIRYFDASGQRQFETLGKAPEWSAAKASKERQQRIVAVENQGFQKPNGKITFGVFAEEWMESYGESRGLKLSAAASYKSITTTHLVPAFGKLSLGQLTPERIERFKVRGLKSGLAPRTVNSHLQCLGLILKGALKRRLITSNPLDLVDRVRERKQDQPVLSPEQTQKIEQAFAELILETPTGMRRENLMVARVRFQLIMGAGLRLGELLGLRWRDCQLDDEPRIRVAETFVRARFDTPKSDAGRRTIAIGPRLAKVLREHRLWSAYSGADELVAPNPRTGNPFGVHVYAELLREAMAKADVDVHIRPHHGLRHSQITQSAAAGADPFALMTRSGHSSMQTTQQYIHLAGVQYRDEAEALEKRLYGKTARKG